MDKLNEIFMKVRDNLQFDFWYEIKRPDQLQNLEHLIEERSLLNIEFNENKTKFRKFRFDLKNLPEDEYIHIRTPVLKSYIEFLIQTGNRNDLEFNTEKTAIRRINLNFKKHDFRKPQNQHYSNRENENTTEPDSDTCL